MKKIILSLSFVLLAVISFSSCKIGDTATLAQKEREKIPLEQKIKDVDIVFYVNEETPVGGGARYQVIQDKNYYFVLNKDFLESYLSYKGVGGLAQSPSSPDPNGVLTFISKDYDYDIKEKDGGWVIDINVKEQKMKGTFTLTIKPDGSAVLVARPLNKTATQFNGWIN